MFHKFARASPKSPAPERLKISAIAGYPRDATGRALVMISTFCRSIVVLVLSALIAACAMTAEQQTARDDERCTARGLQPQSKAHDDCVLGLRASRDTREQQRHRDLVEQRAPTPYGR
jgi:hypothetical protein